MSEEGFRERTARRIGELNAGSFHELEAQTAEKRVAWFRQRHDATRAGSATPRDAYRLFIIEYLGLSADEAEVIHEGGDRIEWLSVNPCPTLEACRETGLDTRDVCRAVHERSTQALISRLDPQLRFIRDYDEIRPHRDHCREMILRVDFEGMMRMALEEAHHSLAEGNKGYGAVVAFGNEIAGRAHDTAVTDMDPSLHAEVKAIREAVRSRGDADLRGGILFSTCEPCPMCSSLVVWSNLTTIVYGASIEETARLGRTRIMIGSREVADRSPAPVEVVGGILRDECLELYS